MSFSGTPLGQGRRLDRDTFLGKPTSSGHTPASPHQTIPPPYTYGAPALGSRSPPKPSSPTRDRNRGLHTGGDEENEPALARFARQKQREAELSSRPGGPKIFTSPPKPDKWVVKDTTVNIAAAFIQAANDMMPSHNTSNNSWASSSSSRNLSHVPRSTSVEYEKEAQSTQARRLAPPPNRLTNRGAPSARKPPSKSASLQHVPDSEGEDERGLNGRAKSPFEQVIDAAKRALAPATFYLQPPSRSKEPEDHSTEQPSTNGNHTGNDSSYDYAAEEQAFQAEQQASQVERRLNDRKRNRMSIDNKAYKPMESDGEQSDEDFADADSKRKRGKGKAPAAQRVTSLPSIAKGGKARKRKGKGSKGNVGGAEEEDDDVESEGDSHTDLQSQSAQLRSSAQQTPVPRISVEPHDNPDQSMEAAEQGLQSIPEVPEEEIPSKAAEGRGKTPQRSLRTAGRGGSRATTPSPRSSRGFSVGAFLGTLVHYAIKWSVNTTIFIIQIISSCFFLFGRVFGTVFDVLLNRPWRWLSNSNTGLLYTLGKYFSLGLVILAAWYILQDQNLRSYLPAIPIPSLPSRPPPIYVAPDIPAANVAEIAERLSRIEFALSGLSLENERTKSKAEDGAKGYVELVSRLGTVEGRLLSETRRISDSETRARDTIGKSISGVKQEVEILQAQILAQQRQYEKEKETASPTMAIDEEVRAKLKVLEEHVSSVEGGVKEALDLGKKLAASPAPTSPGPGAAWWNKVATGPGSKSTLQIKSSDGQDVTALISHLVDSAVSIFAKDGLAKPDFALYSGGARVIPSLTSGTFEIRPSTMGSTILSVITGNGYAIGRPPVTALHHELHNGHCWPFAGSQGQLGVALAAPTYVEEISIDHVAKEVAFDMRSAPREMEVWGLVEGSDNVAKLKAWREEKEARKTEAGEVDVDVKVPYPALLPKSPEYIRIANFSYDIHAPNNVQTFPVDAEIRELGLDFGIVVLNVLENWGMDGFTCLYRFRVHGQRVG